MGTDIGRERAMSSATGRTKGILLAIAAATILAVSAPAVARQASAARKGLSVDDKPYYLDVGATLPASVRRLTPAEGGQVAGGGGGSPASRYHSGQLAPAT